MMGVMSYQYLFCPACSTRRAAYGYCCSVCGTLVRRTPIARKAPATAREVLTWKPVVQAPVTTPVETREPVAA
jgi:hypothetical protein